MITGYPKLESDKYSINEIGKTIRAYRSYKKKLAFPVGLKGNSFSTLNLIVRRSIPSPIVIISFEKVCHLLTITYLLGSRNLVNHYNILL